MPNWSYWSSMLELKLRKLNGDSFQSFVNDVMREVHGDDFVAVRPDGPLGDEGIDGGFMLSGDIYQCYGAQDGAPPMKTHDLVKKIKADYLKAKKAHKGLKTWWFCHNLVGGLPAKAFFALKAVQDSAAADGIEVRQFAMQRFVEVMKPLEEWQLEKLIGQRSIDEVDRSNLPAAINDLIGSIMEVVDDGEPDHSEIGAVPFEKLEINKIPANWRTRLAGYFALAPVARRCLERYGDPRAPEEVPGYFSLRYQNLRSQDLDPGDILDNLLEGLMGAGDGMVASRLDGSLTLIATMFESCVVFEDKPWDAPLETVDDTAQ